MVRLQHNLICLFALCVFAGEVRCEEPEFVVAGYIPDYRLPHWSKTVRPLTDLIYFGMSCSVDGRFDQGAISKRNLVTIQEIKDKSNCRLLLTVGGWNKSQGFPMLAKDSKLRAQFIQDARNFCVRHQFDGIDYDWEHPEGPQQLDAYEALLRETQAEFSKHKLIVTIAQAGWQSLGRDAYEAVDRVHLMSYDHDYPQATFEKAKADVGRLIEAGCPREKIVLGLPFYGRNEDRVAKTYAELQRNSEFNDSTDIINGFAFNGAATISKKVSYARRQELGGVMIWELGQDVTGPKSLLSTIGNVITDDK